MWPASENDSSDGRVVGRDAEQDRLHHLVTDAATGRGASLIIEGEAGSGKTTLLDLLAEECTTFGFRVQYGQGQEIEQRFPFRTIKSCLRAVDDLGPGDLGELPDLLRNRAGGPDWEFCVTDAFVALVDRWTARGPVAFLIDDLHWADRASLVALGRLQRMLGQLPLLLCASLQPALRSYELARALRVLEEYGMQTMRLGPLDEEAVGKLVKQLVGAAPAASLMEHTAAGAGNPLLVTEIVSALDTQGDLRVCDGVVDLAVAGATQRGMPSSLKESVSRRLASLSARALDVLDVAAVLGPRVDLSDLSVVLDTPVMQLWGFVGEAIRSGLLVDAEACLVFRHDLVRRSLLEEMPGAVRSGLHEQAARTLAASGAPPERVGAYLLMAGTPLDNSMVDWLVQTAPALVLRAPDTAADLLAHAATSVRPPDARLAVLLFHLARVHLTAGEPERAEHTAREALATAQDEGTVRELRWVLAQSAFRKGDHDTAVAAAETALAASISAGDAARFQAFVAQCRYHLRDPVRTEAAAELAVREGEAGNNAYAAAYGLTVLATLRLPLMRTAEALELTDRALTLLGSQEIRSDLPMAPHIVRALALMDLHRTDEANQALDRGLRAYESGHGAFLTWYHVGKARLHYNAGRWDDALAETGAGMETLDSLGLHDALRSQAAVIAVHRGDPTTYAEAVEAPDESVGGTYYAFLRIWARALTHEAQGDAEGALGLLLDTWRHGAGSVDQAFLHVLCADLARLADALGASDSQEEICRTLTAQATADASPDLVAEMLYCRGLADDDPGLLLEAAALNQRLGRPLYEGYAQEYAARSLATTGDGAAARKALQAALAIYQDLGADWDAARAEAAVAGAGVHIRRRTQEETHMGWVALTGTERVVAAHVADGLSNPDIGNLMYLSPRTVQFHLSRIYTKLAISSRVELAVAARQHAREDDDGPPPAVP
ncbi:ATP-binding protein [Streptomyces lydicus]|uniref:ATP-binding protein n=1 Tax=Streptomyces lydicus TaxID=47763 RepID=UPI0036F00EE0